MHPGPAVERVIEGRRSVLMLVYRVFLVYDVVGCALIVNPCSSGLVDNGVVSVSADDANLDDFLCTGDRCRIISAVEVHANLLRFSWKERAIEPRRSIALLEAHFYRAIGFTYE